MLLLALVATLRKAIRTIYRQVLLALLVLLALQEQQERRVLQGLLDLKALLDLSLSLSINLLFIIETLSILLLLMDILEDRHIYTLLFKQ
jgi:hypothetical protein